MAVQVTAQRWRHRWWHGAGVGNIESTKSTEQFFFPLCLRSRVAAANEPNERRNYETGERDERTAYNVT